MLRPLGLLCAGAAICAIGAVSYVSRAGQETTEITLGVPVLGYENVMRAEAAVIQFSHPNELLPDLVPLPAQDLSLQRDEHGDLRLVFSTTYLNQGMGPLELHADPDTAGIAADLERTVYQHIIRTDGGYREKIVGNFLWHQNHLHYHYADFITYDLDLDSGVSDQAPSIAVQKSTFCVRDVSRVLSPQSGTTTDATYTICGKELQGVSVGWGDTYYYNYPDQAINIQSLESGTYRLTFTANPERRIDELAYTNNTSYVRFRYDKPSRSIEVIEEFPKQYPNIEHIHLDDPFGV